MPEYTVGQRVRLIEALRVYGTFCKVTGVSPTGYVSLTTDKGHKMEIHNRCIRPALPESTEEGRA